MFLRPKKSESCIVYVSHTFRFYIENPWQESKRRVQLALVNVRLIFYIHCAPALETGISELTSESNMVRVCCIGMMCILCIAHRRATGHLSLPSIHAYKYAMGHFVTSNDMTFFLSGRSFFSFSFFLSLFYSSLKRKNGRNCRNWRNFTENNDAQ